MTENQVVTIDYKEYRDNLAKKIHIRRKFWKFWNNLAKSLLDKEKMTETYEKSVWAERYLLKLLNGNKFDELDDFMNNVASRSLDSNIIMRMLENKFGWYYIVKYIDKFKDIYRVPNKLIDNWLSEILAHDLGKFRSLSSTIAKKLIEKNYIREVAINLDSFLPWWLEVDVAKILIEYWYTKHVAEHLRIFRELNDEVAENLINEWYVNKLAQWLESFGWLSLNVAETLIQHWEILSVATNYYRFEWLDIKWAVEKMFEENKWRDLAENIAKFPFRDREYIVGKLAQWLKSLEWLSQKTAEMFIQYWELLSVATNYYRFEWLDIKWAVEKLFEENKWWYLAENISKFPYKDREYIVGYLVGRWYHLEEIWFNK